MTDNNIKALQYLIWSEFDSFQEYLAEAGYEWEGVLSLNSEEFKQAMKNSEVQHIYKFARLALDGE